MNSVILYDTQHAHPIALIGNLHYANLTDVAWSHDGNTILMSSTDGYCSVAIFEDGELGQLLPQQDLPAACKITHQPHFFSNELPVAKETPKIVTASTNSVKDNAVDKNSS